MPVRDRELVAPPPSLARLQGLSSPAQAAIERHGGEPRDDIAVLVLHRNGAR